MCDVKVCGERFSLRKAAGSGGDGAITGGFRGALIGSGAGAGLAFTSDFIGGAIGNAAEQWIVNGNVDPLESLGSGLVNGLSGMLYGTGEIRGLKDAVVRGARTGAGIGGLGYLLRWGNEGMKGMLSDAKNLGDLGRLITPQVSGRDPRGGCGRKSALTNGAGRPMTHGYRSDGTLRPSGSVQRKSQFSLLGFARETMVGGLMGGLSSAAFYGAGKAVERLQGSTGRYGVPEDDIYSLCRKTSNTGDFKDLNELMQIKNVRKVANKAGIGIDGIKIKIDRNPELLGKKIAGFTDGKTIILYPDAFTDTEALVKTLGHERMHVYQVNIFGKPASTDMLREFEKAAYSSEGDWWNYYNFLKGGKE